MGGWRGEGGLGQRILFLYFFPSQFNSTPAVGHSNISPLLGVGGRRGGGVGGGGGGGGVVGLGGGGGVGGWGLGR